MAAEKMTVSSGSPFEDRIGIARAVHVGPHIWVSGTAPIGADGKTVGIGDTYVQTRRCLEIMVKAIENAGGRAEDVVRTRILIVDMKDWEDAARAHREVFADIKSTSTVVEVAGFIDPDWLVETEADCYVGG